jgi:hypothetical protein
MPRRSDRSIFLAAAALACLAGNSAGAQPATRSPDTVGLGDYMDTFIQPRHAKLGLAGKEGNWPLAIYAYKELSESFSRAAKDNPKYRNLSIPDMFDAMLGEPRKALEEALKARDAAKFTAAYAELTAGCNACHTSANVPFIVIKVPEQSPFSNQDFVPKKR